MLYAFNQGDKFVLAIVLVGEDDSVDGPYYIRHPFDREPGWGVSSINYNLSDLLQKAEFNDREPSRYLPKEADRSRTAARCHQCGVYPRESIRQGHPSHAAYMVGTAPVGCGSGSHFRSACQRSILEMGTRASRPIPPGHLKASWAASRKRLFTILEDIVQWENTTNETSLKNARAEIRKCWRETCELNHGHPKASELFNPDRLPILFDPFAGGGTIPLEGQRLGFEVHASDLNPVAVIINKAMIEIPTKFTEHPPVNPTWQGKTNEQKAAIPWSGPNGLADDIRYYGQWMLDEARKRIGHLYPQIEVTNKMAKGRPDLKSVVGQKLSIIAWLWTRTVKSPNPAFSHVDVPLASTFVLSSKSEREVYIAPIIHGDSYEFTLKIGKPPKDAKGGTKSGRATFRCILSNSPIDRTYITGQAQAGKMNTRLMATVVECDRGRLYLPPTPEMERVAMQATPGWKPDVEFFQQALGFRVGNYGMTRWSDLFTSRQLVALTTLTDLVAEVREKIHHDALAAGMSNDPHGIECDSTGAAAYAESVSVYLAFACNKHAMYGNALVPWYALEDRPSMLFTQQVVSMVWDFTEVNPFSEIGGSFAKSITIVSQALEGLTSGFLGGLATSAQL